MYQVDLNCDLGESYGRYTLGMDEKIIPYITSANIACGYHASDPEVMSKTVAMAKINQVQIGAHIGFPDLMGFGRRNMTVSLEEAKAYTQYQMGALLGFCQAANQKLAHVKPHGAMYNMAAKDYQLAKAICEGIYEIDPNVVLLGLSNSEMLKAAADMGLPYASEVFADRAYEEDGSLVARTKPGAMVEEEELAIKRVVQMVKEGCVTAITGKKIAIQADSVCIHGDSPKALEFAKKIHKTLSDEGIFLKSFSGRK